MAFLAVDGWHGQPWDLATFLLTATNDVVDRQIPKGPKGALTHRFTV
jgi:hypothetical protein